MSPPELDSKHPSAGRDSGPGPSCTCPPGQELKDLRSLRGMAEPRHPQERFVLCSPVSPRAARRERLARAAAGPALLAVLVPASVSAGWCPGPPCLPSTGTRQVRFFWVSCLALPRVGRRKGLKLGSDPRVSRIFRKQCEAEKRGDTRGAPGRHSHRVTERVL